VKVEAGKRKLLHRAMTLAAPGRSQAVFTGAAALPSRGELPAIQRTLKPSIVAHVDCHPALARHIAAGRDFERSSGDPTDSRVDFEWAGETARHVGTGVHDFLRQIAEQGLATWSVARISQSKHLFELELRRLGVDAAARPEAARRVETALINTVEDERGRWLLGEQMEAKSEWRLTGHTEGSVVNIAIDRTFVADDGTRWIIDYKTGEHKVATDVFLNNEVLRYRQQIETYAALLHRFQISISIRLGLYFPMLAGWREWRWES
jgi:ATP-dependent exoDNAse (exonuclease V) beta subunit